MKWPFFSKPKAVNHDWMDCYKQLRKVGRELNVTLVKQLSKAAVPECGKKLGIFKAGTLILNNDDEIAILYDYCLYHYRRDGKNIIQRHLEQSPPGPESSEMILLQAMLKSRFSVFRITAIKPQQGAILQDMVHGDQIDLVDIGISETGEFGTLLIGRLLPLPDFFMSTGTMIPILDVTYQESIIPIIRKFIPNFESGSPPSMSASQEATYVGQLIREALRAGGMDNVFYTDIEPV